MSSGAALVWQLPGGTLGLGLSLAAALLVLLLAYLGSGGRPAWLRALLLGLRVVAVGLVLLLLLRPARLEQRASRGRDHLAVLCDDSASMALPAAVGAGSRLALARQAATAVARHWAPQRSVARFDFARDLKRQPLAPTAPPPASVAPRRPTASAPSQVGTRLLTALEGLRERFRGRELSGAVVVSDGRDTGRLRAGLTPALRARLRALDIPVNVVVVGEGGLRDVAISKVVADDLAFVRNLTHIRVALRVHGAAGERVRVTLRVNGRRHGREEATGKGVDREVSFAFVPQRVGDLLCEVEVQALSGEATLANNTRRFVLRVVRDRLRVLQLAGRPSWDVRFMRQHLKRDPNVDLVSFFILRSHRNLTFALPGELSLIEFPARELFSTHLASFDVVILQNFEHYPRQVAAYLDNVAGFVRQGGGLALLGGEHTLNGQDFIGMALEKVLPVELLIAGPGRPLLATDRFRPRWTALAGKHPITRSASGDGLSLAALRQLPALEGLNRVARARPGAAVLAVHPKLRGPDGAPAPLVVSGEAGRGRVLGMLTDSSWLWRFAADEADGGRLYDAFWRRVWRYLSGDPAYSRLRVLSEPQPYPAGAPLQLAVRALDRRFAPLTGADIRWEVARVAPAPAVVVAKGQGRSAGGGELPVKLTLPAGSYRLVARATLDGQALRAEGVFVTEGQAPELADVAPDPALLAAVAKASGGRVLRGAAEASRARLHAPRLVRLEASRRVPLIAAAWWLWLGALLALGLEWLLRRRFALP